MAAAAASSRPTPTGTSPMCAATSGAACCDRVRWLSAGGGDAGGAGEGDVQPLATHPHVDVEERGHRGRERRGHDERDDEPDAAEHDRPDDGAGGAEDPADERADAGADRGDRPGDRPGPSRPVTTTMPRTRQKLPDTSRQERLKAANTPVPSSTSAGAPSAQNAISA